MINIESNKAEFHKHPKHRPPRHDLRKPKVLNDPDLDKNDPDLTQSSEFTSDLESFIEDEFDEL